MMKLLLSLASGIIFFTTSSSAGAATCNILAGKCGKTKTLKIKGSVFASAVANASNSNGAQSVTVIKDDCNIQYEGAKVKPAVAVTGKQTCEVKVLTGGKSHSKMKKQCAIKNWQVSTKNWEEKNE